MWPNNAQQQPTKSERVQNASRISSDLIIEGSVVSAGVIIVDGQLFGDVRGETISVDENGLVEGPVTAKVVAVGGVLKGDVECSMFTVTGSGRVTGSVKYETLDVDAGAKVSGVLICSVGMG